MSNLFSISLTGGTEREILKLGKVIEERKLSVQDFEINPHVTHVRAIEKMRSLDVIVLPMPASQIYFGFPLKAIEAVASAKIIVAAKCRIYTDIFSDTFKPYWYEPGDAESLYNAIDEALFDSNLEARINLGLVFAKDFIWENRTNKIIHKLKEGAVN